MTREQQKEIVTGFLNELRDALLGKIDAGAIPEDWDGIEIRWHLKEKLVWQCSGITSKLMTRKRRAAYERTFYSNSL